MAATDCKHREASEIGCACAHLVEAPDLNFVDYVRRFTGRGNEYDLVCSKCSPRSGATVLRSICIECFCHIEEESSWVGTFVNPEVLVRPSNLSFEHAEIEVAGVEGSTFLDMRPVNGSSNADWLALTNDGVLLRLDLTAGTATRVLQLPESPVRLDQPVSLHTDRHGRFAAIVNTKGEQGVVLHLSSGAVTMPLDRGEHHVNRVAFPVAFFDRDGRPLLIHATAWNRLDISDPATGRVLTERTFERPLPEASLVREQDYFHGGLAISPNQEWVADNGWVWGAAGIPLTWSLRRWIGDNAWEAEDGPSRRRLCQRWYYWDGPMCWVGDQTLALWGYGEDVDRLVPAAWLFDAVSGEEAGIIAGPTGQFVFDEYLFSLEGGGGTSVWDVATGERLLRDRRLAPTRYHHGSQEFLTILGGGRFRLSRLRR